jgi:hypothetical protein
LPTAVASCLDEAQIVTDALEVEVWVDFEQTDGVDPIL